MLTILHYRLQSSTELGGSMIKIGIEASRNKLRCDLLEHPERYFFILKMDGNASLCIRTCDARGEDVQAHAIDGLCLKEDGNLYSVFEDGINDAIFEMHRWKSHSCLGDEYPISTHLMRIIPQMPDLANWIISSVLVNGKNLVIHPFRV